MPSPTCLTISSQSCSVACNKIHQQNHPPDTEPPKTAEPSHVYVPLEDAKPDPTNKYSFLDNSEEMKKLCAKYPHLPELLMKIGDAAEPDQPAPGQGFMKQGPRPDDATWRRDQGKTRGRAALNRAMMAPGSNGDAIREYHEVVLHFLAKKNGA
jgi:hypothetical protein